MSGQTVNMATSAKFPKAALPLLLGCLLASDIAAHGGKHQSTQTDSLRQPVTATADTLHPDTTTASSAAKADAAAGAGGAVTADVMGIEEKKGAMLPLDARFAQQNGDSVTLGECTREPTILLFLYFGCHDACNLLLTGLARTLRSYADKPSSAPNIVTVSVSESEGPKDAGRAMEIANAALGQPYPAGKWRFLTGSTTNIKKVTDAAGFHFVKRGDDYDHPLLLIILTPRGQISRYITGTEFLPTDLTLSLMEASRGVIQPTIARLLRSCFSYDPKGRTMVFKTLQVSATVIITLLISFIIFLVVASRPRRKKGDA